MGGRGRTLSPMMAPPKTKTRYTLLRFMKICVGMTQDQDGWACVREREHPANIAQRTL